VHAFCKPTKRNKLINHPHQLKHILFPYFFYPVSKLLSEGGRNASAFIEFPFILFGRFKMVKAMRTAGQENRIPQFTEKIPINLDE